MKSKQDNIIVYVGGFELPDKNAAAQRVLANAKIFRDLGYQVVFIGVDKTLKANHDILDTKTYVQGFDSWRVPYPNTKRQWLKQMSSIGHIKKVVEQYGNGHFYAIIGYNYPALALWRLKNYADRIRSLCLADVTEWYGSSGGGALFNAVKWLDTSCRMRCVHLQMDGVITPSFYLTNFYGKKGCKVVELPTLYDVVDNPLVRCRKDVNLPMRFLYAGSAFNVNRVNKHRSNIKDRLDKVITMFSEAAKVNSNFVLDIYGLSKENYLSVFDEHSTLLEKLKENVVFYGRKPHEEIVRNIQEADFTVFIRDIDRVVEAGFPSKFSESISYGTPVLCNMISNIRKYVQEGKNTIIIDKDDCEQQVGVLLNLFQEGEEKVQEMKDYCQAHTVFDYRSFLKPVENFLEEVGRH